MTSDGEHVAVRDGEHVAVLDALAHLERAGARGFDADGCDFARRLLTRAQGFEPAPRARLVGRAKLHLEQLATRFAAARAELTLQLTAAEQARGPLPAAHEALERGEFAVLRRALRRRAVTPVSGRPREERARCAAAYEARRAELAAAISVARAADLVPAHAGPYNGLRMASQLLERIGSISPLYLSSQIERLRDLASLLALPEVPVKKPRPGSRRSVRPASA